MRLWFRNSLSQTTNRLSALYDRVIHLLRTCAMKFKTKGRNIVSSKHPTGKGDFSFQEQHGHENAVFVLACNPRQASASVDFNGDDVVSNRDIAEFNVTQPHSTTDSIHGLFELPASFREAFHRPMRPNSSPANHNSYIRPTASSRARTAPAKSTDQNPRHNKDLHPSSGVGVTAWMDFNVEDPWNWGSFADSSEAEEGEIRFRIESDRRHHPLKYILWSFYLPAKFILMTPSPPFQGSGCIYGCKHYYT